MRCIYLIIILLLVGCEQKSGDTKNNNKKNVSKELHITTTRPKREQLLIYEKSICRVNSPNTPILSSEVSGKVVGIFFETGDSINRGDILASIDKEEIENQKLSLISDTRKSEAQIEKQQKLVDRYVVLKRDNFISQTQLDAAIAELKTLKEQVKNIEASLSNINKKLKNTTIKSPINGKIQKRLVSVGDFVSVGKSLFEIQDSNIMIATFAFPESLSGKIKKGAHTILKSKYSNKEILTQIKEIKPQITKGAIEVVVEFDNSINLESGSMVEGSVLVEKIDNAMMIPELSIALRPVGEVVYEIKDGVAIERKIKSRYIKDGYVEVIEGLKGDEVIALDGANFLSKNMRVSIKGS